MDEGPRDPGLQLERTWLAWQRTGVVSALVGGGAALAAAHRRSTWVLFLAAVGCVVVAAVTVVVERRPAEASYSRLVLGAGVALVVALVGVVLALT